MNARILESSILGDYAVISSRFTYIILKTNGIVPDSKDYVGTYMIFADRYAVSVPMWVSIHMYVRVCDIDELFDRFL